MNVKMNKWPLLENKKFQAYFFIKIGQEHTQYPPFHDHAVVLESCCPPSRGREERRGILQTLRSHGDPEERLRASQQRQ